jgi:hypothetical protein
VNIDARRRSGDPAAWQDGWAHGHAAGWRARGSGRRRALFFSIVGAGAIALEHAVIILGWL